MLATERGCVPARRRVLLTGGRLVLAPVDWEAAGHTRPRSATVASFAIDSHETTEQDWAECVRGGACPPAPARDEPGLPQVEVTAAEAERYCQWRGGALPTTDQLAFASVGPSGRRYPWGDTGLVCRRAAFGLASGPCARSATGPELAGSHPAGASPEGVFDLVGNVAEWTRPEGGEAAVRGGSWRDVSAEALHGWSERRLEASRRDAAIGWRCVYAVESGP
jgi:formylglycine-generating enzyme required for sulfatase activity